DPLPRCALPDDGLIVHFGPSASRMRQCRGDARARHFDTVRSISGTRFRDRFRPRGPTYNLHKFIECRKRNWCFFRPERDSTAISLPRTQNGKDEMPPFTDVTYVYDPEALKIMGAAFDVVCQTFPPDMRDHEGARRRLALIILRHMDQRERMQRALVSWLCSISRGRMHSGERLSAGKPTHDAHSCAIDFCCAARAVRSHGRKHGRPAARLRAV